jgi:hypothetical protein
MYIFPPSFISSPEGRGHISLSLWERVRVRAYEEITVHIIQQ